MIPAPVELALPEVFLECVSCLFQRKRGIPGVGLQGGAGGGSGSAG